MSGLLHGRRSDEVNSIKRIDGATSSMLSSREVGRARPLVDGKNPTDCEAGRKIRTEGSAAARWRAIRRLARKLHDSLVQYEVDNSRETCYTIVMLLDSIDDMRREER